MLDVYKATDITYGFKENLIKIHIPNKLYVFFEEENNKPSTANSYCTSAIGNWETLNYKISFLLFKYVVYKMYKDWIYSHNKCFLTCLQKDPWVI